MTTTSTTSTDTTKAKKPLLPIPMPDLHNVASLFETVAFIVAAILYLLNNGADQNHAVATALFGAIFHAYNH